MDIEQNEIVEEGYVDQGGKKPKISFGS